jgi:hypothetical protein
MSRAELEHALARVLEGKEIRLKNNKLLLQPRCIEPFTIPRVKTHWPVIFAISLIDLSPGGSRRAAEYNQGWPSRLGDMDDSDRLKQLYKEVLAKSPFPTEECSQAQITAAAHGALILYLADIAGLASRGEQGLAALSDHEKESFRDLASKSIATRLPEVRERITPDTTPKLDDLIEATERARLIILDALHPQLT